MEQQTCCRKSRSPQWISFLARILVPQNFGYLNSSLIPSYIFFYLFFLIVLSRGIGLPKASQSLPSQKSRLLCSGHTKKYVTEWFMCLVTKISFYWFGRWITVIQFVPVYLRVFFWKKVKQFSTNMDPVVTHFLIWVIHCMYVISS